MAIACRPHRLLFIMAPRTGCTAVGDLLVRELNGEFVPGDDLCDERGDIILGKKHCTLRQLREHGVIPASDLKSMFSFSCVRNPFDSLVSMYVKKRSKYQRLLADRSSWVYRVPGYVEDMEFCRTHSFEEWIAAKYAEGPVRRWLRRRPRALSGKYVEGVDYVMRYERLQEDFNEVLRRAGVKRELTIPTVNATAEKNGHYRDYYTPQARKLVERAFADEIRRYGYTF
jgi:hypothetical protein